MKNLFLSILAILSLASLPTITLAGPASPDPVTVTQPDGSRLSIQIRGDEHQNWHELADTGETLVRNRKDGSWEYAVPGSDGTLQGSGIRATSGGGNAPKGLPPHLKPPRDTAGEERLNSLLRESADLRGLSRTAPSGIAAAAWLPNPVSGPKNLLVILINFADRPLVTTPQGWYDKSFNPADKSVAAYYRDNSFGAMSVAPIGHAQPGSPAGIIAVTVADNHPNSANTYNYATESTIINHALAEAARYVDFAGYDTDGDGVIAPSELTFYFVYAGYEASGSAKLPSIWAHAWGGSGVSVAGKEVRRLALNGELNNSDRQHPMGVITHELGHSLCGLPDLYDTSYTNRAMGGFSLMASGSWGADTVSGDLDAGLTPVALDAWSREYLGWSVPVEPPSLTSPSLGGALSAPDAAWRLIDRSSALPEYFLVENRIPAGWDRGLTRYLGAAWSGGLLITHIDPTVGTVARNDINRYVAGGHQGVVPEQANTATCDMLNAGGKCNGVPATLFWSGNNDAWTPATLPNSRYYGGLQSPHSLTGISPPGAVMTALYQAIVPEFFTVTGTVRAGSADGPPLAGATVTLAGVTAVTDSSGGFTLTGLTAGSSTLTITATGYVTFTDSSFAVAGDRAGLTFVLNEAGPLLAAALNATLTPVTGGNADWFSQSVVTHDGVSAAQAGTIGDNQHSFMEATVTGPDTLSFWWKVSSEKGYDFLTVAIDGIDQDAISGEVDWSRMIYPIPAGTHTVRWSYRKDPYAAEGADTGWVDQAVLESDPPAVNSVTPRAGATGVPVNRSVTVVFNKQMNAATDTPATFTLQTGGIPVPGAVRYDAPRQSALFTPDEPLLPATDYTATVTTGVADAAGRPLTSAISWSFSTGATLDLVAESFDSVTTPGVPEGWISKTGASGGVWQTRTGTRMPPAITAASGSNLVYFNSYRAVAGETALLYSPLFSLSGVTGGRITFRMYRDSTNPVVADRVEVYLADAAKAALLGTIRRSAALPPAVAADGWYDYSFPCPATFTGAENRVIFRGISAYGSDIHLDDIAISAPVTAVTLLSNPAGRSVTVDGKSSTTPRTFSWIQGSSHTVDLPTPQAGAAGTRYLFSSWSDGGARSHPVTTPATPLSLRADFTTQFQLTTAVSPVGSGYVTPATGGWYRAGTVVPLRAVPNKDYAFSSWSGPVVAPAVAATAVAMTGPVAVTATLTPAPFLTPNIIAKSGAAAARVWTVSLANSGRAEAVNARITALTLTQNAGAACTPAIIAPRPFPLNLGAIPAGGAATGTVTIDFSGCPAAARFTAAVFWEAAGGFSGSKSFVNQFR